MTAFGIYLVIVQGLSAAANLYYASNGGTYSSPGVLIFAALWALLNLLGILLWGTGLGLG